MNDIQNQDDLYLLVNEFYKKLLSDDAISYIFTDVVKIKLEEHLPILVTFWSQAILGTGGYTNNLTQIHLDVNTKEYLSRLNYSKFGLIIFTIQLMKILKVKKANK
jgi:hemoglobin